MKVTLGFDVEEFDFPIERGREIPMEVQLAVSSEGLEAILALLAGFGAKATFYTTANFASHRRETMRRIVAEGHEVASHDYYHARTAVSDPAGSKRLLEEVTGTKIVGYRAPRLAVRDSSALVAAGFLYDSSVNPTWIPGRYNNLDVSRNIFRADGLTIYPTSVAYPFRIPLFWLSLHVMPWSVYRMLCRSALHRDGHLNLYFHPWEFSDRFREPVFGMPGYLTGCCGVRLLGKLERLLDDFGHAGCHFVTTGEYLGFNG